ncbi:single-stranded-DNA-specific exonuclease RecJ [Texcoconibacillus texcoconensis]|uniref:Single-stranded-DNA-specific exonuclease RecJ n=1 Tax=Texcoconibacillus texcoconensis TaxID=1095777 RepID=A0A840QPA3_9BACI|nr:single-stranded-DNA-specific exonuclease RecJ [Texcoconibacillus texcoconensis]MBB5173199.1 single-stranded-DNA-specific exonuclease [Texcoconibacillus texcoconensis]
MLRANTRWEYPEHNQTVVQQYVERFGVSTLTAKVLAERGFQSEEDIASFLQIDETSVHDPFLLKGMNEAVPRIQTAIRNREPVLIFGDYDADGVSSTAVLYETLASLGAVVDTYIPNRFTEGYGPNEAAFRQAHDAGCKLIITVDTGISAVAEAKVAKELGIDLIVTDHHEPPPELPNTYATINPKQPGCTYPFPELAGVGVAFKLSCALLGSFSEQLLAHVAIGTIADLVPLTGENRYLAKRGIIVLKQTTHPGLQALKYECGIDDSVLSEEEIGFAIGPRINAAGRLDSADPALMAMTATTFEEGQAYAKQINQLNEQRQGIVRDITEEAKKEVEARDPNGESSVIVVAKEGWNEGVIGIVASRLVEAYYRPTIVLSINPETGLAKGSARSIEGFNMFEELSKCREWLPRFGGHKMAAGLTMETTDIERLRQQLNDQAKSVLTAEDFTPLTNIDLVADIQEVTEEAIEDLQRLAPFGIENPKPNVLLKGLSLAQKRRIGAERNHLKVMFEHGGHSLDAIGFRFGEVYDDLSLQSPVDVVGALSINEWNGHRKPQLMMKDIAVDEWQLFDLRGEKQIADRLQGLPKKRILCVSFREETLHEMKDVANQWETISIGFDGRGSQPIDVNGRFLVLLDLPITEEQVTTWFKNIGCPDRIYPIFHQRESQFFSGAPSKEDFRWFYAFLKKHHIFHLETQTAKLIKARGWRKEDLTFMIQVFFELDFVKINEGTVKIVDQPEKRSLTDSLTYQRKIEETKIEQEYLFSSYQELKQKFAAMIENKERVTVQA